MRIAFIGLGIMGAPMAGHLIDADHELFTVKHRSPTPQALGLDQAQDGPADRGLAGARPR
jgi:3-hydroxyisobutyrate dehydrogenase-like beta-hydroxyacid dehydrogenase